MNHHADNRSALLLRAFWRLHFWAGIITAPLVLFAALTGLLYTFTPQIEAWKHRDLDIVSTIAPAQSLDAQIAAARAEFPGKNLRSIIPAFYPEQTTQILFGEKKKAVAGKALAAPVNTSTEHQPHAQHQTQSEAFIAYINPGNLTLQGHIAEDGRFKEWARKLHSNMLQGDGWRWLIELAACWMLIMMITGIYLWWPRGKANWSSVLRRNANTQGQYRRANWRYFHSIISIVLGLLTITILLTGMTWAKYAGENFRSMQTTLGQSAPKAPKDLQSSVRSGTPPLSAQTIYEIANQHAPHIQMQLTPPKTTSGVWRVESVDRTQPGKRFQFIIDAYSGQLLYQTGWQQLPILAQATAVGIPFHRGEFGWWNQALLVLVACSVIFSVISGYAMWLQRRKANSLSAPKISTQHARAIPWWIWGILLVLGCALPVLGMSLLVLLLIEALLLLKARQTNLPFSSTPYV